MAQQLAAAAREAERRGNHKAAADLYAKALTALMLKPAPTSEAADQ
jgi:hypothetical protein